VYCTFNNGISEKLTMQSGGQLVFYDYGHHTWASPTSGYGYQVDFQSDGNLVVRDVGGTALWASNTHTYTNAVLAFQSDGNLVIYPSPGNWHALWATGTQA
jgi:hypothetical protein